MGRFTFAGRNHMGASSAQHEGEAQAQIRKLSPDLARR